MVCWIAGARSPGSSSGAAMRDSECMFELANAYGPREITRDELRAAGTGGTTR